MVENLQNYTTLTQKIIDNNTIILLYKQINDDIIYKEIITYKTAVKIYTLQETERFDVINSI